MDRSLEGGVLDDFGQQPQILLKNEPMSVSADEACVASDNGLRRPKVPSLKRDAETCQLFIKDGNDLR